MPRIKASTVLVRGEADAIFSNEDQHAMLQLQPSWKLITVSKASHSVQWDEHGARVLTEIIRQRLDPAPSAALSMNSDLPTSEGTTQKGSGGFSEWYAFGFITAAAPLVFAFWIHRAGQHRRGQPDLEYSALH